MPFCKITKLLFLLLWLNLAMSQNYPGNNYTAANDLPNNTVRSLLVDSNNSLWIGTDNGIVKKENDIFNYFFEEDGLALNSCWAIVEDSNKNLWFGSYGKGLSIFDGISFKIISRDDGLVHNEITKFHSSGNKVFVGTSDGVSVIDINTFEIISPEIPREEGLFRVQDFFEYKDEIYVAVYNYGVFQLKEEGDQINLVKHKEHKNLYSVLKRNDSIYSSHKGFFVKSAIENFLNVESSGRSSESGQSIIWDFAETRRNKIFAAAWGIFDSNGGIYEIEDLKLISRATDFNIPSKEVISLAYDGMFEKLYVGTRDAGLFEINLNPEIKFNTMPGKEVLAFAAAGNTSALLFNDGLLLGSTENKIKIGLIQLKQWQENYVKNTQIPLPRYEDSFYELDYSIRAENIKFYDIKVSGEQYWINTNIGIFVIESSGDLIRFVPLHSEEINFTEAGDLIETHPYGGLRIYSDLDNFKYTHYKKEDPLTPTMVVNSLHDGRKTYLLSVFSGLFVWENQEFKSYLQDKIWEENRLRHITTLENHLAVSNDFGDVYIIDDQESFQLLKKIPRAEIQGNTIYFLNEYNEHLIIGTEKGLTLVKDDRYIFLDKEQGLKQPLLGATVKDNILSIGSREGYYTIDLEAVITTNSRVNDIEIEEIFINNNKFPSEEFSRKNKVSLAHNENTLLLKFSTNAHPYPHKLKYRYRLDENENWSLPSSRPEIFLPFLPADNYNVDVQVLDDSTGLNFQRSLITLSILPPFWESWWFAALVITSALLIVYGVYRFQINQTREFEKQKRRIQQRFEETKMEALLAQMNPHFIFNAMNSIQNYIMDSDIDNATVFLGDFAKLIRLNLDHCTKPKILLVEEIEYLQSYIRVENTRFNNAIKVNIDVDPEIDVYDVEIPTMLIQTFIENVFVHAFPAGRANPRLKISFNLLSENVMQCKIEDNGVGYIPGATSKLHNSKGVNLVKERLGMLGYEVDKAIDILSAKDKGTTIIMRLDI